MDTYNSIKNILNYPVCGTNLIRIIIALGVLLLFFLLNRTLINKLMVLLGRLKGKVNPDIAAQFKKVFEPSARTLLVITGIALAAAVLKLPKAAGDFMTRSVRTMIAFVIFWTAYRASDILSSFFRRFIKVSGDKSDNVLMLLLNNTIRAGVFLLAATVIMQEWGYDMAGLLAGLGLGGLAFALAAKDAIANLFGSIMIMLDRPFTIGDWVLTSRVEGVVEDIGFRSTRVRTLQQALVTIPNSLMSNEPITNLSRIGKRRINFRIALSCDTPVEILKECISLLQEMLVNHPEVIPDTVFVHFERFNDGKLEIMLYLFTKTADLEKFLEVQEDINFRTIAILQELGLFPKASLSSC